MELENFMTSNWDDLNIKTNDLYLYAKTLPKAAARSMAFKICGATYTEIKAMHKLLPPKKK